LHVRIAAVECGPWVNAGSIPNYGERRHAGEAISGSTADSAVNQTTRRQMSRSSSCVKAPAARTYLQVRARVLNDQLANDSHRWHPGFTHVPDQQGLAA
jgi:hypothetical protein